MELLIFLLLSPVIFAQDFQRPSSNDQPFLPIFPEYPYNPKLVKRGSDRETSPSDPYLPKTDVRDTHGNAAQRNSYSRNRNHHQKTLNQEPGQTPYQNPYNAYGIVNSYSNPYASFPNYFYPFYPNPNYFYQPYSPPPGLLYSPATKPSDIPDDKESKKSGHKKNQLGDVDENRFVDGANYISDSGRDPDVQSSSYKEPSPRNKLEGERKKIVYRVINIPGQQLGADYLSSSQAKMQLEELMKQTLIKLLTQSLAQPEGKNGENNKTGLAELGAYGKIPTQIGSSQSQQKSEKPANSPNVPKTVTKVTLERSLGLYITPFKTNKPPATTQSPDYEDYEAARSSQETKSYASGQDQSQDPIPYPVQNVVTDRTPRAFGYRNTNLQPDEEGVDAEKKSRFRDESRRADAR